MLVPNTTIIGGLPFKMTNEDIHLAAKEWSFESHLETLSMSIRSEYGNDRALTYYFTMVADWLLDIQGWIEKQRDEFKYNLGSALYFFVRYNRLEWIDDPCQSVPVEFNVNGVYYHTNFDCKEYMTANDCLGECRYTLLEITIKPGLPWALRNWVVIHELTHAILFEANYTGDHNDESLVKPLGTLIYRFLKDNPELWRTTQNQHGDVDKTAPDDVKPCQATTFDIDQLADRIMDKIADKLATQAERGLNNAGL